MALIALLTQLPLLNAFFCAGISAYVLSRDPAKPVNWHFSIGLAAVAAMELGRYLYLRHAAPENPVVWIAVALAGETFLPSAWLAFSLSYARESASSWRNRSLMYAAYAVSVGFLALAVFGRRFAPGLPTQTARSAFSIYLILSLVVTVANFELTLRASDHRQRWRSKFLLIGIGVIAIFQILWHSLRLLYPMAIVDISYGFSTAVIIGCVLIVFSLVRHSLLGVDVYVSRDMIFRSFTIAFVGGFLLASAVIAELIYMFGGSSRLYFLVLFLTVGAIFLGMVLLSERLRKRTRDYINRNFYRNKYEYRKEWLEWTDRLGSMLSAQDLMPPVERMIYENFWISRTVLWLYEERRKQYTIAFPADLRTEGPSSIDAALGRALIGTDYPVPVGGAAASPMLADAHRRMFSALGVETVVPLVVDGQLLGILGLSKSNFTVPLNHEDYDYLKIIAKQVAGVLHRARLSETLVDLKEREAFHSFSAFVLHDLKNFIAMLTLVLANADRNMDNPEFRKDMTASIAKTVAKMKSLMEKLAAFSGEPLLRKAPVDLNRMLSDQVAEMRGAVRSKIREEYRTVPSVALDPEEMAKVVRNLVVNADESIRDGGGEIRIGTSVRDGKVTFTVSDNGQGMSREFREKGLFRLFSTTKQSGFGIGLYQSRKIVEAHGGEIEVASEEGRGSMFTILLPSIAE